MHAPAEQSLATDGDLLAAFVRRRDEAAFATLVDRPGPLVLAVCRARVRSAADAEDAAQAVFLTLARKASSLTGQATVAGWLHRVAWYVAARAAKAAAIRHHHEQRAAAMKPETHASEIPEDAELLHAAIEKLPEKYRMPLLLHHFEGRTQAQTAALLGLTESAASVRLTRARELLRKRLARTPLPATPAALAPALAAKFLNAAVHPAHAGVAVTVLSQGASRMLTLAKLKVAAIAGGGAIAVATGIAVYAGASRAPTTAAAPASQPAPAYALTLLPTLGGDSNAALGINSHGQIVGSSDTHDPGVQHAFLFDHGKSTDLGTLGGANSRAMAINDQGQIVGGADVPLPADQPKNARPPEHAFLYDRGAMHDLGTLGGPYSIAFAINNTGQIVGQSNRNPLALLGDDPPAHAFLYEHNALHDLGGIASLARAINDHGQIAGASLFNQRDDTGGDSLHAFLYHDGQLQDLGTFDGFISVAYALNIHGDIAGFIRYHPARDGDPPTTHACLFHNDHAIILGTLGGPNSTALSINDAGQIVGFSDDAKGSSHAFLYTADHLLDLNTTLPPTALPDAHLSALTRAAAINNQGQIVGTATTTDGQTRAFLLTPTNAAAATHP